MADGLISVDVLKSRVLQGQFKIGQDGTWYVLGLIDSMPTIEAEPIRHGHWIEEGLVDGNQNRYCRCSECGKCDTQAISQKVPYCWWCGARMDESGEDPSHPFAESVMMGERKESKE